MKIVILEPLFVPDELIREKASEILAAGHELVIHSDRTEDEAEYIQRGLEADIIVTGNLPISENMVNAWPKLKFIPVAFTGLDHIALDACEARGVEVMNA